MSKKHDVHVSKDGSGWKVTQAREKLSHRRAQQNAIQRGQQRGEEGSRRSAIAVRPHATCPPATPTASVAANAAAFDANPHASLFRLIHRDDSKSRQPQNPRTIASRSHRSTLVGCTSRENTIQFRMAKWDRALLAHMPEERWVAKTAEANRAAGFMPLESGIILPVPEAELVVDRLRHLHDPQARYGVPAHITLLYPFAHPSRVGDAIGALHHLFSLMPVFEFSLVEVHRFPATAYLRPEPSATFVRLTETLARQWPEFPPYRGSFSKVIPHLTVADHAAPDALDMVDATVSRHLPIACRATEAWLMCSDEHGLWSPREVFRLQQS